MRELLLKRKDIDHAQFVKRTAQEADFTTLIEDDVIAIDADTKQIIFVQKKLDFDDGPVLWALDNIRYQMNTRSDGLKSYSRVFGFMPRRVMRGDFCNLVGLAVEQPRAHAEIVKYGVQIASVYSEFTPEVYEKHMDITKSKILDEYSLKDTPFTSGIINKNNPLKYHFDSGNFKNVYSCMAVFKKFVRGGFLSIPEYGVGVSLPHNSVFMFDGQSVLHGVTPITKTSPNAVRYSIVYYSLQQIWNCLPLSEEIARIRNLKTKRERARAKGEVHEAFNRDTK